MKALRIFTFLATLLISGCKERSDLDESLLQAWLSSDEVINRNEPAIFSSQRTNGSWVAIATGDFVEAEDGISINSEEILLTGFYVFPGRGRVDTIGEAVAFCRSSTGRKYQAEQDAGHRPTTAQSRT